MLAQIVSKKVWAFSGTGPPPPRHPFGTIVFVAEVNKSTKQAKIIWNEAIFKVALSHLEFVSSEKGILSWNAVEKKRKKAEQKIVDAIDNLYVE